MLSTCEMRRLDPFITIIQHKPAEIWLLKERKRTMKHALNHQQTSGKGSSALWERPAILSTLRVMQVVLALFFLYGGLVKLVPPDSLPGAALAAWLLSPLPKPFVYFTGISEMLGGLGLILPMYLRILPILTPLAAIGLIIEMVGATVFILIYYPYVFAASSVVTGLLLAFVGYGCWVRIKKDSFVGRTR
jgi:putative oxidoreductase